MVVSPPWSQCSTVDLQPLVGGRSGRALNDLAVKRHDSPRGDRSFAAGESRTPWDVLFRAHLSTVARVAEASG
jgi:hypothetical protein